MHRTAIRRATQSSVRDHGSLRTVAACSASTSIARAGPLHGSRAHSAKASFGIRSVGSAGASSTSWQPRHHHFTSSAVPRARKPFILADIGEGITQVEIVKWNVEIGQVIQEFDPVVEVMSDKATVEITSPYSGKIVALSGSEGDTISVGKVLLEVDVESEEDGGKESAPQTESLPPSPPQTPTANEPSVTSTLSSQSSSPPSQNNSPSSKTQVWATPATRRLAKEHDIDLSDVHGTGPQGRVLKGDVLQYVANGKQNSTSGSNDKASPSVASAGAFSVQAPASASSTVPLSPVRKAMYRAMTASLAIPHFSYSDSIDVTDLERLRQKLNKSVPLRYRKTLKPTEDQQLARLKSEWNVSEGERVDEQSRFDRLTMLPLLIKALSLSMHEHPLFTCTLDSPSAAAASASDANPSTPATMTRRANHDISIALSAPSGGLFTPCLPAVDTLSSFDIASRITTLQSIAQSTTTGAPKFPEQTKKSGTITLSNVGVVGGTTTHPIIPPTGQLAIGAIGRTRVEPKFIGQQLERAKRIAKGQDEADLDMPLQVEPRLIMDVTFSADHRVVEGVELAKLVETWKRYIEDPDRIVGYAR
ncbi:hypothetical protein OIV83_003303 [Microbotryomycetes sp. JL201]|nr:hypothetical protein OIV83_003303 [Microbotryomycetes sp. JL201]